MNPEPSQKLIDFNADLEALCKKYQYELRPAMEFDPFKGLFPVMKAIEVSPKAAEGVPLGPTPTAPASVDSAPAEVAVDAKKNPEDSPEVVDPSLSIASEPVDKPAVN